MDDAATDASVGSADDPCGSTDGSQQGAGTALLVG